MTRSVSTKFLMLTVLLVTVFVFGFYVDAISNGISELGFRLPQKDVVSDYITGLVVSFIFGLTILIWPISKLDKKALLNLWAVKVFVVLFLMLFYEYTYGLDAYYYFRIARAMDANNQMHFIVGEGSTNLILLLHYVSNFLPTANSFHASKVLCAYAGLIATYILYRGVVNYLQEDHLKLLFALALFPSMLFWSSTLGKEPYHFLGVALFLYGILSWIRRQQIKFLITAVTGVMLMSFIRIWTGAIFMSPLVFFLMRPMKNILVRFIVTVVMLSLLVYNFDKITQKFHLDSVDDAFERATVLSSAWNKGGSALTPPKITNTTEFLAFAPLGVFSVLFRPLPGEVMNIFGWIAGIENMILLYFMIISIRKLKNRSIFRDPLLTIMLFTPLIWGLCYCTVAYQNMGTAMRFKFQVIPYFVILIWYLHFKKDKEEDVCVE